MVCLLEVALHEQNLAQVVPGLGQVLTHGQAAPVGDLGLLEVPGSVVNEAFEVGDLRRVSDAVAKALGLGERALGEGPDT